MKLSVLGSNQTKVEFSDNSEVFFSYNTPVAAFVVGEGFYRTEEKHSPTTSRHTNAYLRKSGATMAKVATVPQSFFDGLVSRVNGLSEQLGE